MGFITASPKPKQLSIHKFYKNRNNVLIMRDAGGLGDIVMCRMLFEDVKLLMPECHLTFACPTRYHDAIIGHPFVDEVIESKDINLDEYGFVGDITHACVKYEDKVGIKADKHRSDIWAEHCGFTLKHHKSYLTTNKYQFNKPTVLVAPISAISSKNLDINQINPVIDYIKSLGYDVYGIHKKTIENLNCETIVPNGIKEFFNYLDGANAIITVDTSAFHIGGALNKPMVAVFSWACGKVYGQYYSNFELVQRHHTNGNWDCGPCYRWALCPKTKERRKPCITEITSEEIIKSFNKLINV